MDLKQTPVSLYLFVGGSRHGKMVRVPDERPYWDVPIMPVDMQSVYDWNVAYMPSFDIEHYKMQRWAASTGEVYTIYSCIDKPHPELILDAFLLAYRLGD